MCFYFFTWWISVGFFSHNVPLKFCMILYYYDYNPSWGVLAYARFDVLDINSVLQLCQKGKTATSASCIFSVHSCSVWFKVFTIVTYIKGLCTNWWISTIILHYYNMHFLTLSYIWGIQWISLWSLQKIFVMFYRFTSVLVTFVYHFHCHCKCLRKEREDGYFNFLNVSHLSMCSHFHFIMLHWLLPNPAAFGVCYLSKLMCISDAPVYLGWNSFFLFFFFFFNVENVFRLPVHCQHLLCDSLSEIGNDLYRCWFAWNIDLCETDHRA